MLTFEIVLSVFDDYLKEDADYEVVITSRGYTVMGWESERRNWNTSEFCPTPEVMRDLLLNAYASFTEMNMTDGERNLTQAEEAKIEAGRQAFIAKCEKEAQK